MSGTFGVRVGEVPVIVGDQAHEAGATFEAPEAWMHNALGYGRVEKVEAKAKR